VLERLLDDLEHGRVDERFAAGEVELLGPESQTVGDVIAHLVARHQRVVVIPRSRGDEAVRAGEIAQRSRHLDPQRVEMEQGLEWRHQARRDGRLGGGQEPHGD